MMLIDTHCHLTDERLLPDAEEIISSFARDGLESAVCVGYDVRSSEQSVRLAEKYGAVYAAVGIHPHDAKDASEKDYAAFCEYAKCEKVVAIGEIGLDYFYDLSPRDVQKRVFAEQLELADSVGLPVILHVRDAYGDALQVLKDNRRYLNGGVILHCYSGSKEMMREFDAFGCYYSFGGAITFKNAKHNIEALASVPRDRLVLETDCPYMTPVPFRGRTNYPKYVSLVADKAAEVLGMSREEIIELTSKNAKTIFGKLK